MHRHLTAHMDKLKLTLHELEQDAETAGKSIQHSIKEVERKAKQVVSPKASSMVIANGEEEEGEEGWASDRSSGDQDSTHLALDHRKRSRSPQLSPKLGSVVPSRRGRRRNSMRRGLIGHAAHFMYSRASRLPAATSTATSTPSSVPEEDEGRGRFSTTEKPKLTLSDYTYPAGTSSSTTGQNGSRPSTAQHSRTSTSHSSRPGTGQNSPRHFRVDSIKALHSPDSLREVSPSRSVRFADDENRSGANTPRMSIFQNDSRPGTPTESMILDDPDSARNKVTFDLPKPGKH